MHIYYKECTLYIDITNFLTNEFLNKLKTKMFKIIDEYDINYVVVSIFSYHNKTLIKELKKIYYQKYQKNLLIK